MTAIPEANYTTEERKLAGYLSTLDGNTDRHPAFFLPQAHKILSEVTKRFDPHHPRSPIEALISLGELRLSMAHTMGVHPDGKIPEVVILEWWNVLDEIIAQFGASSFAELAAVAKRADRGEIKLRIAQTIYGSMELGKEWHQAPTWHESQLRAAEAVLHLLES